MFKHLDLFSGIGGFALAARWMGWETVQFVEIDHFCQAVLKKNFGNVPIHGDIKTFGARHLRGTIGVLTGGFPCQPFSNAGKRKGKDDDRYLWPEMLRVAEEVQPSFIVGENVYGFLNWTGGVVFEQVQADLENIGYQVTPIVLPACGVGAPHKRDRVWIIANRYGEIADPGLEQPSTYTNSERIQRRTPSRHPEESEQDRYKFIGGYNKLNNWREFPTQPGICGRDDGIPNRVDRIKGLGNAIVPQVAFEIFKAIEATNNPL